MKRVNILWILFFVIPLIMVSCKDEKDEPLSKPTGVVQNIIGSWLLSTSDAENWAVYDFTETARLNVEMVQSGYLLTGKGFYSVDEKNTTVTGSYSNDRGQTFYIDWIVNKSKAFQIDFELYDLQTYVGDASIYRVVGTVEINAGVSIQPQYRDYTGYANNSEFLALDPETVNVDPLTGEITALKEGVSFVTFKTSSGTAAIKINSIPKLQTLPELIVGTWIYDNRNEHEWQRTTFYGDGSMSVEWEMDDMDEIGGYGSGNYEITDDNVKFRVNMPDGTQIPQEWRVESFNDYECTYNCYTNYSFAGKYTGHKRLESVTLSPEETKQPDYQSLVGTEEIQSYKSHNETVATVSSTGEITAMAKGRTYIDVNTSKGSGVIEVNVDGGAIPVAFEDCVGKGISKVHEILGDKPYYEDEATVIYKNFTSEIDMVGVSLDTTTGLANGVTITYNSTVSTSQVTTILDATFIPYMSQTTDTFKAYMDTAERADASVGVTWDIPKLTLTYVNLATDLFTDYSVLVGMTKAEVLKRMGREPDSSNDQSQSWFFFDNKGIMIVGVYYTDFVNTYDNVRSVVTMLDDTLTEEQVADYLKKKYPYYPEYSSADELVFIPEGHAMEIFYQPKEKMIMYISTSTSSKSPSRASINKLKSRAKCIYERV